MIIIVTCSTLLFKYLVCATEEHAKAAATGGVMVLAVVVQHCLAHGMEACRLHPQLATRALN